MGLSGRGEKSQGRATVLFIIQQTVGGPGEGPGLDTLPLLPWVPVCFPNLEGLEALSLGKRQTQPLALGMEQSPDGPGSSTNS
jgi:hypothetical protein